MTAPGQVTPRASDDRPASDPGRVLPLLLFEAADCLMALPAVEVVQLIAAGVPRSGESGAAPHAIDLGEHFGIRKSVGPWLGWSRGRRHVMLRVDRVVEVRSYTVRALAPMPKYLRAGPFWAAGVRGDEVFLLMDPARFEQGPQG